jgi:hypothetical protein
MPDTPPWAEIIDRAVEDRLIDVHFSIPAKVTKWDVARNSVDVILQIKRVLENEDGSKSSEELPPLVNVPFAFPKLGNRYITIEPQVGDFVEVNFSEQSLDRWRDAADVIDPGDQRRHSLTGAYATFGPQPNSALLASTKFHSTAVVLGPETRLGDANSSEALVKGDAFQTNYDAHVHTSPFGPTGATTTPITTELSTKHKID